MLSYFQLLCHWLFNLLDNTLEIQWMTQWKTHMCQIYFALLWSLQVFSASKSYCVGGLKFYSSFPHFSSQPWDHPNCFWFFLCLTRPACQDASDSPSASLALKPIKYIRKGSKREKKNISSLWILVFRQLHWYPVTFKEMEIRNLCSFSKCFKKDRFCTECSFIMTGRPKSAILKFLPNSWQQPSLSRWLFYKALVTKEKW